VALVKAFHQPHRELLVNYFYLISIIRPLSIFMLFLPERKAAKPRNGISCRPVSQLPRAPNYRGLQDLAGIIADMALVNSGFHMRKNFFEDYPHLGHAPTKIFSSRVLGQTFSVPGAPTNLGSGLTKTGNLKTKQISFGHR
jgi:hypothetical protein